MPQSENCQLRPRIDLHKIWHKGTIFDTAKRSQNIFILTEKKKPVSQSFYPEHFPAMFSFFYVSVTVLLTVFRF